MERVQLASLVFRLHPDDLASLKALSKRTRIRQSEYLREALGDLLMALESSEFDWKSPTGHALTDEVATHVLVPADWTARASRATAQRRITLAALCREAVYRLLAKYPSPSSRAPDMAVEP